MIIYYSFYSIINVTAPLLLAFLKPELLQTDTLLAVSCIICGCSVLGLVCLVLYYLHLHPRENRREADEVDGLEKETENMRRMRSFLQP